MMGEGGVSVYVPPAMKAAAAELYDERKAWETLRKSLVGLMNKVNSANIKNIVPELLSENLVRGRGLFCRSCINSQAAFPDVFAAVAAVVNSKFPEIGHLLVRRLVLHLRSAYKRNDKRRLAAAAKFVAHLVNQRVAGELLALEMLTLLLENPTEDGVEVAVGFVTECGSHLQEVSPRALDAVFDRFRGILHEGEIDKRVQFLVEGLFALRKAKRLRGLSPELDLVEEEDLVTHQVSLLDDIDGEYELDVFRHDPEFEANEERYEQLKKRMLEECESADSEEKEDVDEESSSDDDDEKIRDESGSDLVNLRRSIYLTIMSCVDFEEAGHKLMMMNIVGNHEMEMEVCVMLLECCRQERTYLRYYALLAQRLCALNTAVFRHNFETCFARHYATAHRMETNSLRNIANFFAHLFTTDALPWDLLACIRLTEDDTTSSSLIFLKFLFQQMSHHVGIPHLNDRIQDLSAFSDDTPRNVRFAINFFTSIGLGGITEKLRSHLRSTSTAKTTKTKTTKRRRCS